MNITMTDSHLSNSKQLETFLGGTKEISFESLNSKKEKYTPHDIALLNLTDNAHSCLNSWATKNLLQR